MSDDKKNDDLDLDKIASEELSNFSADDDIALEDFPDGDDFGAFPGEDGDDSPNDDFEDVDLVDESASTDDFGGGADDEPLEDDFAVDGVSDPDAEDDFMADDGADDGWEEPLLDDVDAAEGGAEAPQSPAKKFIFPAAVAGTVGLLGLVAYTQILPMFTGGSQQAPRPAPMQIEKQVPSPAMPDKKSLNATTSVPQLDNSGAPDAGRDADVKKSDGPAVPPQLRAPTPEPGPGTSPASMPGGEPGEAPNILDAPGPQIPSPVGNGVKRPQMPEVRQMNPASTADSGVLPRGQQPDAAPLDWDLDGMENGPMAPTAVQGAGEALGQSPSIEQLGAPPRPAAVQLDEDALVERIAGRINSDLAATLDEKLLDRNDVKDIASEVVDTEISELAGTINKAATRIDDVASRVDKVGEKVAALSTRLDEVAGRLSSFEQKLDEDTKPKASKASSSRTASVSSSALQEKAASVDPRPKPMVVQGFVLKSVVNDAAWIQTPSGLLKVKSGDHIPDVGWVTGISRGDGRWMVSTSAGIILP